MGLADLILGKTNPFSQFVDANGNKIAGIGAGLAAGPTFSAGLANAAQNSFAARPADNAYAVQQKAEQERLANISKTAAWLKAKYPQFSDLPVDQGFQLAAQLQAKTEAANVPQQDPADVATYKFYANQELQAGRQPKSFDAYMAGTRPGIKGSLGNTLPFLDPKTQQLHPIQVFTDGSRQDLVTGQPPDPSLTYAPYDLSAVKAGGGADATNAAIARNLLPGATQSYNITKSAIDQLNPVTGDAGAIAGEAENFGKIFGFIPNQLVKYIQPGTPRATFLNIVDQLSGDAFLNVRQALKGAGQVTDYEGQKGEQAISRMKAAADRGDDKDFRKALVDFQTAMENGLALLKRQAQGDYAAGNVPGLAGGIPQGGYGGDLSGMSDADLLNALGN